MNKAHSLVENCRKKNWYEVAILQLKNKDTFREIVFNLRYYYKIINYMFLKYFANKYEDEKFDNFDVAIYVEVKGNENIYIRNWLLQVKKNILKNVGW